MEKVTTRNADVHMTRRVSAHKRKREKAQDQLRHRMRKRNNGSTESMVSSRLRSSQRDPIEGTTGHGLMKTVWNNVPNSSHKQLKDPESHYSALSRPGRPAGSRRSRQSDIPLSELVSRVIQRTGQTTTDRFPMTIRALKPPAPPYAFHHQGILRKIQPVNRRKSPSDGPYVLVLNRSPSTDKHDKDEHPQTKNLPPLKQQPSSDLEIGTWRPTLNALYEPYVHPNAEDRFVTNYRLQMQQAIKIAELRCDFSTSSKPMHKHAPLPAIQVTYEVADQPALYSSADDQIEDSASNTEPQAVITNDDHPKDLTPTSSADRFTSSQEILQQMQARNHAKRRTAKGEDFNNPLRTRNRFTTRMKMFKQDLQKARELSMIQEDQSSISERLSRLSAGRASAASLRSAGSLKRIEETESALLNLGKHPSKTEDFTEVSKTEIIQTDTSSENDTCPTNENNCANDNCANDTCNIHASDLVSNRSEQPTSTQCTHSSSCEKDVNDKEPNLDNPNSQELITKEQHNKQASDSQACLPDERNAFNSLNEDRDLPPSMLWQDGETDSDDELSANKVTGFETDRLLNNRKQIIS